MKNSVMVFIGASTLTTALVVGSGAAGCRSESDGGGSGAFGTTTTPTTGSTGGSGGSATALEVSIQQITDSTAPGHVGPKTLVKVAGSVAMSKKFLVSKGSSGSCLWGVFLSAPSITTTGPNTGMLALSYGTPATASSGGKAYCPTIEANQPAGDAFPDDVSPGDVLDVMGMTDSYIPSTCSGPDAGPGASMIPGIQLTKITQVTRGTSKAPLPTPAVLSASDVTTLAGGANPNWFNQWGNVKIEIQNVTAMPYQGMLTDTYGHLFLTNGIQVGDKLYYVGYVKAGDACYSGPTFPTMNQVFESVSGFVYLDYCTWDLVPSDKCHDLQPPSADCVNANAGADAGADADASADASVDPSVVCTH
jgi:hypothetical protein